jgi:predicted small lipoprotein YifL
MTPTSARRALALAALALAACGQKGPLYLPDSTQGEVVTRPTQTPPETSTDAPNSPATPDSPQQSPSPAPEVTAPVPVEPDEDSKKKDGATPPK